MWEKFTERARQVMAYAQDEAARPSQNFIAPEHLLLGLARLPESGELLLERLHTTLDGLRAEVQARLLPGEANSEIGPALTRRAKTVIDFAYEEAKRLKDDQISVEHLMMALLREKDGFAAETLQRLGITLDVMRGQLQQRQRTGSAARVPPDNRWFEKQSRQMQDRNIAVPGIGPSEELLSLDEAVKFLGTSRPTLYRLLGQEEIKGLKVGRQWRFRRADLTAYMERSPVAVAAAPSEDLDMELAFFAQQLEPDAPAPGGDAESKTVALAESILRLAIQSRASDIHLEPTGADFLLRLRVDGVLQETRRLPAVMRESLAAQFKTMAEMNLTETRLPQDGRIPVKHAGKDFDIRVAAVPSVYGEALTLRILLRDEVLLGLDKLGLAAEDRQQVRDLLRQPNGIVLAAGPTGSGKTTLLYSCLQEVVGMEKKTLTVEDPVEVALPYATQTQVNKKAGLTFATALRSFLRQDPDILLVGEMRDRETTQIAVEAALTGHLVLSALHTNDAPSALLRLLDMGVEPYLLSATVTGIVATRLARRVCDACTQPVDLSRETALAAILPLAAEGGYQIPPDAGFVLGAGCEQCRGRGYRGRLGLYEVLTMTEALAEAVLRRAPAEELTDLAVAGGMRTLLADGVRKAVEGQTTIEEVMRVVSVSV